MLLFCVGISLLMSFHQVEGGKKIFCYYSSSSNSRPDVGKFWPEHIDPFLCTHLIFAFVDISEDGRELKPNNWNDLGPDGLYKRTMSLKNLNPKLKILLAVGGWKIGSKPFLPVIKNPENMKTWVDSVVTYLRKYKFDGLDVDWEFPGIRGSKTGDKKKFTFLMKLLYNAFAEEAKRTHQEKLILTLATASSNFYISKAYEPEQIIKYVDYMLLMTYNYHGSGWEKKTGHHSPLWPHGNDPPGEQKELHQACMLLFCVGISLLMSFHQVEGGKKIFCYYSSSSNSRPDVGKFWPEHIDPFLCTHLIFAFVDISEDGRELKPNNWNDLGPDGLYKRTMSLKNLNPKLKILLAVGGWKIGSKPFLPVIKNPENMKTWVDSVVTYLRKYKFDGLDVDWEFPGIRGSKTGDKKKFTFLMKLLYNAFAEEAKRTHQEKLILTLATASSNFYISKAYEPEQIINYVDYMLLMTYNYHGSGWEKKTGHHSPLWPHGNDPPGEQQELHQQWSIDFWLSYGISKEKLIVGLPTYGLTFKLQDPDVSGVHAPVDGGATKGKYTGEQGILSFYEICEKIQMENWVVDWIDSQEVPFAHGNGEWVGFESPDSIRIKASNIMERDLGGAFVWSLEMDDFSGHCGEMKYPLLTSVHNVLSPVYDSDERLSKAGAKPPTSQKESVQLDCNSLGLGLFWDPSSCKHFNICVPAEGGGYTPIRMDCPAGTRFDKGLKICNHAHKIECW